MAKKKRPPSLYTLVKAMQKYDLPAAVEAFQFAFASEDVTLALRDQLLESDEDENFVGEMAVWEAAYNIASHHGDEGVATIAAGLMMTTFPVMVQQAVQQAQELIAEKESET